MFLGAGLFAEEGGFTVLLVDAGFVEEEFGAEEVILLLKFINLNLSLRNYLHQLLHLIRHLPNLLPLPTQLTIIIAHFTLRTESHHLHILLIFLLQLCDFLPQLLNLRLLEVVHALGAGEGFVDVCGALVVRIYEHYISLVVGGVHLFIQLQLQQSQFIFILLM